RRSTAEDHTRAASHAHEALWSAAVKARAGLRQLGARQSVFGTRQSALGTRHSALGARRSALGARHSALGARALDRRGYFPRAPSNCFAIASIFGRNCALTGPTTSRDVLRTASAYHLRHVATISACFNIAARSSEEPAASFVPSRSSRSTLACPAA